MSYELHDSDKVPKCDWEGCVMKALTRIYTDDCSQSMYACWMHRFVIQMNLEMTNGTKLRLTSQSGAARPAPVRPSHKPKPTDRPGVRAQPWEREAAKKASERALPLDEEPPADMPVPIISDIPKPRRTS